MAPIAPQGKPSMARFHDGSRRVALLLPDKDDPACAIEAAEERAEELRLLYVGLTRARLATWVVWGAVNNAHRTAMAWLLHRSPGSQEVPPISQASLDERRVAAAITGSGRDRVPSRRRWRPTWPRLPFAHVATAPQAAIAARALDRDWWVYSFSQLAREDSGVDSRRRRR